MSFGVGAGDAISVTLIAWNLYKNCRNSGAEFERVADDLKNLYAILREIDETIEQDGTGLSHTRAARLDEIRANTRKVLQQLESELSKYGNLDTKTQKRWDTIRWGLKDISDIKQSLMSITTTLNAFCATITHASHSRLENLLKKYLDEVQKGRHEGSVLTDDTINTKQAWQQLRKELEDIGINAHVLNEKRDFIVKLIQDAKADGTIDDADIPDFDGDELSRTTTLIEEQWERRLERLQSGEVSATTKGSRSEKAKRRGVKKRRLNSIMNKLLRNDSRIIEITDEGDLEGLLKLIDQGVNVNATDKWDWTALHMAAYGGYDEMARVLIEEGADLDARTVDNETPKELAEIKGHAGVVRIIEEELERRDMKAVSMKMGGELQIRRISTSSSM